MAKHTAVPHKHSIGVIHGGHDLVQALLIDGISSAAAAGGLDLFIFDAGACDEEGAGEAARGAFLNLVNKRLIDGLIVLPGTFSGAGERFRRQAFKRFHPLPLVAAGFHVPGAAEASADTAAAMNELVAHLAKSHGRKKIAFLGPSAGSDELRREFRAALARQKLPFRRSLAVAIDSADPARERALARFCARAVSSFDAVVAADAALAALLFDGLLKRGVRVPADCAVVSCDDGPEGLALPLTAIVSDYDAVGRSAVERLTRILEGASGAQAQRVCSRIAYRSSCGCLTPGAARAPSGGRRPTNGRRTAPRKKSAAAGRRALSARIATLFPPFAAGGRAVLETRLKAVIDGLAASAEAAPADAWRELVAALAACREPLLPWLDALDALAEREKDGRAPERAEFFSAARRAVVDTHRAALARRITTADQRLPGTEERLCGAIDLDTIRDIIASDLPGLGYDGFCYSLSVGENQPLHYSRLEAGRLGGTAVRAGAHREPYLTNRLLPPGLENRARRQTWCVQPLFSGDRFLGLLLLSAVRPDTAADGRLRRSLRGAIGRALTFRECAGEAASLRTQLASQADSLLHAGQNLQKEKRAAERLLEELKTSETRYRRWFEEDFTGNFIAAANGDIINCNSAFARMFGFPSIPEALGANFGDFYPNKSALEDFYTLLGVVKRIAYYETEFVRKDGSLLHIIGNIIGTFDEEHNLVEMQGFLFDNTERKRLEDELRHAHKMDAIGRLAGGIAHDFNNILTGIMGYSELLLHKIPKSDPSQRDVEEIKKAAKSAASLTRQLLAFSRKQILQPLRLDLNDVVTSMRDLLIRIIGEHITLIPELDPELKPVKADRGQIEQVIMNLVINARDALPHGGNVVITTRNRVIENTAEFTASNDIKPGPYVVLEVTDNGVGMDLETQSHIFEPFFSTKKTGQGVGLGLSTVYGIVTQSGGFPEVMSEPHRGTTMRIYLPQYLQALSLPEPRLQYQEDVKGDETILLVEDEGFVRELAEKVLTREGFHVIAAHNAHEALSLVKKLTLSIDLVVTDVVMPGISGVELGQKIQAMRPEVKVLYMSGYDDKMLQQQGEHGVSFHFIQKPFTPEAFLRKVQKVLND